MPTVTCAVAIQAHPATCWLGPSTTTQGYGVPAHASVISQCHHAVAHLVILLLCPSAAIWCSQACSCMQCPHTRLLFPSVAIWWPGLSYLYMCHAQPCPVAAWVLTVHVPVVPGANMWLHEHACLCASLVPPPSLFGCILCPSGALWWPELNYLHVCCLSAWSCGTLATTL